MEENILLVGGCGYLGGAITEYYLNSIEKYHNVNLYVYDIILYEESYRKNVNFIYGDVRNTIYLIDICSSYNITTVIWLASIVGDDACNIDMSLTNEINFKSLERFSKEYDGKILFTSTASVYGVQGEEGLLTEKSKTNPVSLYALTKLNCEDILKDKNAIIFRMGTLFGLSDNFARIRFDLVINKLTLNAYRDNYLTIYGGTQYRPFLHVRDAAKTIFNSVFIEEKGIFNICSDNKKIIDLVSIMKFYFENIEIEIHDTDLKDTRNYKIDSSKAVKGLFFNPDIDISTGVLEIKKLLEERRIKDLNNFRYSNFLYLSSGKLL